MLTACGAQLLRHDFKMKIYKEELKKEVVATKPCPKCKTPWWKNGVSKPTCSTIDF